MVTNNTISKEDIKRSSDACRVTPNYQVHLPYSAILNKPVTEESKEESKEEWVWVTGYKGTSASMTCHGGFTYELGKLFQMPKDSKIEECKSGFHLCMSMSDVRKYYPIGDGNRYFEVQALVRKSDVDKYGTEDSTDIIARRCGVTAYHTKLVAKSIVFTRELTADEILTGTAAEKYPEKYKQIAIRNSIGASTDAIRTDELVTLGYSKAFAEYIVYEKKYKAAKSVAAQKDLSMDMRVLAILRM